MRTGFFAIVTGLSSCLQPNAQWTDDTGTNGASETGTSAGATTAGTSTTSTSNSTSTTTVDSEGTGTSGGDGGGLSVWGVDQFQSDATTTIELQPVPQTAPGDVTWVVVLRSGPTNPPSMTPPDGFERQQHSPFVCGYLGSTIDIYQRTVVGPEPESFAFELAASSTASAVLVTLRGVSDFVETSDFSQIVANPIRLNPLVNGPNPAWGFAVYAGSTAQAGAGFQTFTIPEGQTRIIDVYGIALFGVALDPGVEFVNDSAQMVPEGCGFAYAAVSALE